MSQCRICFGADEPLLVGLCGCEGSLARVHRKCLEQWLTVRYAAQESDAQLPRTCDVCHKDFRFDVVETAHNEDIGKTRLFLRVQRHLCSGAMRKILPRPAMAEVDNAEPTYFLLLYILGALIPPMLLQDFRLYPFAILAGLLPWHTAAVVSAYNVWTRASESPIPFLPADVVYLSIFLISILLALRHVTLAHTRAPAVSPLLEGAVFFIYVASASALAPWLFPAAFLSPSLALRFFFACVDAWQERPYETKFVQTILFLLCGAWTAGPGIIGNVVALLTLPWGLQDIALHVGMLAFSSFIAPWLLQGNMWARYDVIFDAVMWADNSFRTAQVRIDASTAGFGVVLDPAHDECVVKSVTAGSRAHLMGLQPGDVLLAVNSTALARATFKKRGHRVGDVWELERAGAEGGKIRLALVVPV